MVIQVRIVQSNRQKTREKYVKTDLNTLDNRVLYVGSG